MMEANQRTPDPCIDIYLLESRPPSQVPPSSQQRLRDNVRPFFPARTKDERVIGIPCRDFTIDCLSQGEMADALVGS